MNKYKHIFFDLDQTLWDFDTNCSDTLTELFEKYELNSLWNIDCLTFIETYKLVNKEMWQSYHKGLVSKETLRMKRFDITFQKLGIATSLPNDLNVDFLKICPSKSKLVPYALELLEYLSSKYQLHIATNGFKESQFLKISNSNIGAYFKHVFHSEMCGFLKPDIRFFNYSLNVINAKNTDCIMIGDDLEADVLGAKNAGIDNIYLNPERIVHYQEVTLEISCLSELFNIL